MTAYYVRTAEWLALPSKATWVSSTVTTSIRICISGRMVAVLILPESRLPRTELTIITICVQVREYDIDSVGSRAGSLVGAHDNR